MISGCFSLLAFVFSFLFGTLFLSLSGPTVGNVYSNIVSGLAAPATSSSSAVAAALLPLPLLPEYAQGQNLDVLFVVDVSGSMELENRLARLQEAAMALSFVDAVPGAVDIGLLTFNDQIVEVIPPGSTETVSVINRLRAVSATGDTVLYDALTQALDTFAALESDDVPIIVLISDGQDTGSVTSYPDVVNRVAASDVLVIPVAYGQDADFNFLSDVSSSSGTPALFVGPDRIEALLSQLALELIDSTLR